MNTKNNFPFLAKIEIKPTLSTEIRATFDHKLWIEFREEGKLFEEVSFDGTRDDEAEFLACVENFLELFAKESPTNRETVALLTSMFYQVA